MCDAEGAKAWYNPSYLQLESCQKESHESQVHSLSGRVAPEIVQDQCNECNCLSKLKTATPKKNSCDKQASSWRHISCHTDKNRYYT